MFIHDKQKITKFRLSLFALMTLSLLFGVGWGVGLTASSTDAKQHTLIFQVVFGALTILQGLSIFSLHVIFSTDARNAWWTTCVCCKKQQKYVINTAENTPNAAPTRSPCLSALTESSTRLTSFSSYDAAIMHRPRRPRPQTQSSVDLELSQPDRESTSIDINMTVIENPVVGTRESAGLSSSGVLVSGGDGGSSPDNTWWYEPGPRETS